MKFYDMINVPGLSGTTNNIDEGVKTSAPSSTTIVDNTSPEEHETLNNPVIYAGDATPELRQEIRDNVSSTGVIEATPISQSYADIFNKTIAENRGESYTPSECSSDHDIDNNENKYVKVDEVDYSNYNNPNNEFEVDVPDIDPSTESTIEVTHTENSTIITETFPKEGNDVNLTELLTASILGEGKAVEDLTDAIANKVVDKIGDEVVQTVEVEVPAEPEYSLDKKQLEDVVSTFDRYEKTYFSELPIKHLSKSFLRNIPKHVYQAHQDVTDKYEAQDILDPLFLLYITLVENPYEAMGKFINIIWKELASNPEWEKAIDDSESEYERYMKYLDKCDNDEDDCDESIDEDIDIPDECEDEESTDE